MKQGSDSRQENASQKTRLFWMVIIPILIGIIAAVIGSIIMQQIYPPKPVIIKEQVDSMKVIHTYVIPSEDSLGAEVENRVKNLELLKKYDLAIENRLKKSHEDDNVFIPSLLISSRKYSFEGWTDNKSSGYFSLSTKRSDNSRFLDFYLKFHNSAILSTVEALRLLIYRIDSKGTRSIYDDYYYQCGDYNPQLLRLSNDLEAGSYEMKVGFILKSDVSDKYPAFYNAKYSYEKQR